MFPGSNRKSRLVWSVVDGSRCTDHQCVDVYKRQIYAGNEAKSGLAQDLDDCHNSERGGQRARRGVDQISP